MRYNSKTMMLEGLSETAKTEIVQICRDIILNGKIDRENQYVKFWLEQTGMGNVTHGLLLQTTVMPCRLLLSVVSL